MTTMEMAQAVGESRGYLLLSDAMAEAVGGRRNGEDDDGPQVRRTRSPDVPERGIRYQRCGGGRRIIRRQARGAN